MSDKPADYIEFDLPKSEQPEPEPMDVEEAYRHYYQMREAQDTEGLAEFLEAHAHPAEFLSGYDQWVLSRGNYSTAANPTVAPKVAVVPSNPNLPPQGNGDVPLYHQQFPVWETDEFGHPLVQNGQYVQKKDGKGRPISTDGQGNIVIDDDRGLGDAAGLFDMSKAVGGKNHR